MLEIYLAFILHLFVSNCYVQASFMPSCFKSHGAEVTLFAF